MMTARFGGAAEFLRSWRERAQEVALVAHSAWLRRGARALAAPNPEPFTLIWPRIYSCASFAVWFDALRAGLAERAQIESAGSLAAPARNCEILHARYEGETYPIVIDCGDSSDIDEALADRALVFFKMQFRRRGYGRPNVTPGGYGPQMGARLGAVLPALRAMRDRRAFAHQALARFDAASGSDRRRLFLDALAADGRFALTGEGKTRRPRALLAQAARARVVIHPPGEGDFSCRFVDYLAVGACVVAARHGTRLPVDLVDGREVLFVDKPEEAADACAELLADPDRIEAMASAARAYYDRHLTPGALAAYYAAEIRARLPGAPFP